MQAAHPMGIIINALEYAKRLREAGVDQVAAEAQASALADALNQAAEHRLATKEDVTLVKDDIHLLSSDLKATEQRLDHKIDQVESRLELKVEKLETRLTTRMFMLSASTVTILSALMTVLHFH